MPLPSQIARGTNSPGPVILPGGRGRTLAPAAAAGGIVLVIALGVWAVTRGIGGEISPRKVGATPPVTGAPGTPVQSAPDKLLASNDTGGGAKPAAPVEIRQGRADGRIEAGAGQVQVATPPSPAQPAVTAAPRQIETPAPAVSDGGGALGAARARLNASDLVGARAAFSRALADGHLSGADEQVARDELTKISESLVFSPRVAKDDPFADTYLVQGGDNLIKIAQKLGLAPDYRLIARVNGMKNLHSLREGQKIKVVKGPFHAVVHKGAYRLDLYMGAPDKPADWVYVRSFRVGLGADDGTPAADFIVKKGSKLIDPPWTNPRTGEHFAGGDPKNPIGHRWIGLEGVGESAQYKSYGIHGTIEPESIGRQMSMGCVRMAADDIDLMFELMGETVSTVKVVP